jgi:predicted short-subunit dehydrogenase-like oxidoreductase (DUF2520 family)
LFRNIVILGAGNVAHHFVEALHHTNLEVIQIYSRSDASAKSLAEKYAIPYSAELSRLSSEADLYLFLLSDTGIKEMAETFPYKNKVMIHSSGSIPMDIFVDKTTQYGVFYPYQTFRKEIPMDFAKVPLCLEASDVELMQKLVGLAENLNCKSYQIDSRQRQILHLAAVFACNFMNHCIHIGENILNQHNIEKDLLNPLLEQSFNNVLNFTAEKSQTGPAIRNDKNIMNKHLELLSDNPEIANIYQSLSQSIKTTKKQNNGKQK